MKSQFVTSSWGGKIVAIRELLEKTLDDTRKKLPSRVYSKELIELLFHQPYTKGQFLVDAGITERKTAAEYLKELERIVRCTSGVRLEN